MAPAYPPTPASQWPEEYKPYAEWVEERVAPTLGPNGQILTYQNANGGLEGPFPVIVASKDVGQLITEAISKFGSLGDIPKDAKEVAILTVGAKFDAKFEQYAHYNIATKTAGLTHDQCVAMKAGKKPEGLSPAAAATYDASYHLVNKQGPLPQDLYDACVKELGKEVTLLMTHYVAMYCYMCVLMNAMRVPLPDGIEMPV
ncbi:hypothetical protein M409DRAFT_29959 [Zasmidium cellare ATCC 36951]|uniref:Carboxymuconolactone decarboxylase-like domain-containing protein n=1 Tax=Zasmidium cellare ATCC 36951 TaxID=1080233 RepID=A0A6A6C0F8_ZASCE|nr:uncharacterized protein M409DRAFT_29959 [Zasmidium cellare ATCC 36951]KAF2159640.1 hypothetical protein M409DRAFT_29959 [Zasmidium cellare ATCC 36951]